MSGLRDHPLSKGQYDIGRGHCLETIYIPRQSAPPPVSYCIPLHVLVHRVGGGMEDGGWRMGPGAELQAPSVSGQDVNPGQPVYADFAGAIVRVRGQGGRLGGHRSRGPTVIAVPAILVGGV